MISGTEGAGGDGDKSYLVGREVYILAEVALRSDSLVELARL